jgi:hypothetical protein
MATQPGHTCYHARGINLWGNVNNQYFDVRSGLLIGYRFHQWMGHGPEKAETRQIFDRYTPTEGLLVPMRATNYRDGKLQVVARNLSVQSNNVDPRVFETPPAIKALLHRSA